MPPEGPQSLPVTEPSGSVLPPARAREANTAGLHTGSRHHRPSIYTGTDPSEMRGTLTGAQRSLRFARSLPGITSALVGMNRKAHIEENLRVRVLPRLPASFMTRLCAALDRVS
jgi:aryl-alcohol dehydrogenase-like predicted oxidoreductase